MRSRAASAAATATAALLALGVCGCGSSGSGTTATSPTTAPAGHSSTSAPSSTTATTTTATTMPTTTTTTTTTVAGTPPCVAADLSLTFLGQQGATGHGELGFALRNTGSVSCKTFGFPGIQFLDGGGRPLPTVPTHTTQDFFGTAPKVEVVLAPGQSGSFRLGVTHGAAGPSGCGTAYALQVIPPDDTATLRTALDGGVYECRTATVSPVRPGNSAYP